MLSKKIAIIGLDCVPDALVFETLAADLPTLRRLMDHGVWGTLVSTDPPITIPAWTTITTGRDPGELGLYGFRNRLAYDRYELTVVNSSHVHAPRVWDYLEAEGADSLLIAIPQTYPPQAHRGITVAGFPTPSFHTPFCYPPEIASEVEALTRGNYVNDVKEFRNKDKHELLADLYRAAESRFTVAREFIINKPWDFFMMVETETDRLHHAFWADHDEAHPRYVRNNPFEQAIPAFYRFIDEQIGSIVESMPDETTVMVVSDHGAGPRMGAAAINEWLLAQGYLTLSKSPREETPLTPDMVDWTATKAWGEGGYYARIFLNVRGREPYGQVSQDEYEPLLEELTEKLRIMTDPRGRSIRNTVLRPPLLYRLCRNAPPDLMVYFDDLNYRSSGLVGTGEVFPDAHGGAMDEANHKPNGMFIMARLSDLRAGRRRGQRIGPLSCMDVAPTALQEVGVQVPPDLRGRAVTLAAPAPAAGETGPEDSPPQALMPDDQSTGFSEEEEAIITQRLKDLGYM